MDAGPLGELALALLIGSLAAYALFVYLAGKGRRLAALLMYPLLFWGADTLGGLLVTASHPQTLNLFPALLAMFVLTHVLLCAVAFFAPRAPAVDAAKAEAGRKPRP